MQVIMQIQAPSLDNSYLAKLESLVDASHEAAEVRCEIEPTANVSDCFNVVAQRVNTQGGKLIFGWQVWLTNNLIEAEAHAVWENLEGELIDITPKEFPIQHIVFLEDKNRKYEGKQIDSFRLNITTNGLVDDLITVNKAIFSFDNRGERANHHDLSALLNNEQIAHKIYMLQMKNAINMLVSTNGTRQSKCPCGSNLKFKNCHGRDLLSRLMRVK